MIFKTKIITFKGLYKANSFVRIGINKQEKSKMFLEYNAATHLAAHCYEDSRKFNILNWIFISINIETLDN